MYNFLTCLQSTPDVSTSIIPVPEQPQVGLVNLVGQAVPPPPPITGNVDPTKIEEIRRTIYVGNLNTNVSLYCNVYQHILDVRICACI